MKKIKTDDGGEKVAAHVTLPAPDTIRYAQWAGDTIKYHSDDQIYEFADARVKAALASNKAAAQPSRAECAPINQCDGCQVGAPMSPGGNHHMPDGGFMGCTKDRYVEPCKEE